MEPMSYSVARWIKGKTIDEIKELTNSRCTLVFDHFDRPILLFANEYALNTFAERNEDVELIEALAVDDDF